MIPPREATIEGRVFLLTIVVIIVGVFALRANLEIDWLNQRLTAVEAAVDHINQLHENP